MKYKKYKCIQYWSLLEFKYHNYPLKKFQIDQLKERQCFFVLQPVNLQTEGLVGM